MQHNPSREARRKCNFPIGSVLVTLERSNMELSITYKGSLSLSLNWIFGIFKLPFPQKRSFNWESIFVMIVSLKHAVLYYSAQVNLAVYLEKSYVNIQFSAFFIKWFGMTNYKYLHCHSYNAGSKL